MSLRNLIQSINGYLFVVTSKHKHKKYEDKKKKQKEIRDKAPYFSEALGFSLHSFLVNPALRLR